MSPVLRAENGNKLLSKVSLSIPTDERDILEISLSRTCFAAGASVFDGRRDRVIFIEKGIVSPMVLTREGDPLGIGMIGSEGAIGLPGIGVGNGDYGFQFRALTAVEALQINAQALGLACSRSRELESLLRHYSQALFNDFILTLTCHYHHKLDNRLPRWLLMAAERLRSNRLPVTQDLLAEAHGVTQGAISLRLDALERWGLVERASREIVVLNRRRLKSKACRCHSAIDQEKKYIVRNSSF